MAPTTGDILKRNAAYSNTHESAPDFAGLLKQGGGPPRLCIVTCCDPRVHPEAILGLEMSDAVIFRAIGGHPRSSVQDIATLDIIFGDGFQEVMVIHHTDCGSLMFDVPQIRSKWVERDPSTKSHVDQLTFGAVNPETGFNSQEEAVRSDVQWLKDHPLMRKGPGINFTGYIYDIYSGKLNPIVQSKIE